MFLWNFTPMAYLLNFVNISICYTSVFPKAWRCIFNGYFHTPWTKAKVIQDCRTNLRQLQFIFSVLSHQFDIHMYIKELKSIILIWQYTGVQTIWTIKCLSLLFRNNVQSQYWFVQNTIGKNNCWHGANTKFATLIMIHLNSNATKCKSLYTFYVTVYWFW